MTSLVSPNNNELRYRLDYKNYKKSFLSCLPPLISIVHHRVYLESDTNIQNFGFHDCSTHPNSRLTTKGERTTKIRRKLIDHLQSESSTSNSTPHSRLEIRGEFSTQRHHDRKNVINHEIDKNGRHELTQDLQAIKAT